MILCAMRAAVHVHFVSAEPVKSCKDQVKLLALSATLG